MDSTVKACILSCLLGLAAAQFDCPYEGEYCDLDGIKSDDFPLTGTPADIDAAAEECYTACNDQAAADANGDTDNACKAFTVLNLRGRFECNLIRENCVLNIDDVCIDRDPQTCLSGPSDCAVPPPTCDPVVPLDDRVRWQCVDITEEAINPYNDVLPLGTRCYQTCLSWESATDTDADGVPDDVRLVSECIESVATPGAGEWSETQNVDNLEMAWPLYPSGLTYYPKPDEADPDVALACGCKDLEVQWPMGSGTWYNPNNEEAAVFICDEEVDTVGDTEYTITSTNTCVLYCDDHFVATAKCLNGEWTGNPEWGFWCYDEPTGM